MIGDVNEFATHVQGHPCPRCHAPGPQRAAGRQAATGEDTGRVARRAPAAQTRQPRNTSMAGSSAGSERPASFV